MNSVIRWAGSKRKLLPKISAYWDESCLRYVEPFAGSAALFFHVKPKFAILNDNNSELIHAYKQLQEVPSLIYKKLSEYPKSQEFYYELRAQDAKMLDDVTRAARFFYLNRYCFNGIYRVNAHGKFNVPYAKSKTGNFPALETWLEAALQLKKAEFSSLDFENFLLRTVKKGDFVYLDPPYAVSNRRVFSQYSLDSFGLNDMDRLAKTLEIIDARGARFVVSYALSPEGRSLTGNWHVQRARIQRNVAGFQKHRRIAIEVLISNHEPRKGGSDV
ncbi:MAG: hypothetical protein C0434_04415 [Xanthomonadaceae bacterium]|nr:hypothetical protein [Xanthomonadaceae bacterium]